MRTLLIYALLSVTAFAQDNVAPGNETPGMRANDAACYEQMLAEHVPVRSQYAYTQSCKTNGPKPEPSPSRP